MSLWWELVERPTFSPESLDRQWDVLIVGAGFSGLWSAHHLLERNPELKIAVVEKSTVGSGASGRNGGWASALYPVTEENLRKNYTSGAIDSLNLHLRGAIDEIEAFTKKNKIDCGFAKGGTLTVARNKGQLARMAKEINLNAEETASRIGMRNALGSHFTPDCAAINPAALVVGLAKFLQAKGVSIYENTTATISPDNCVSVNGRTVESKNVIRATESYHANSRDQIPVYSLMIATDPLPHSVLASIGLNSRETFSDGSFSVNYAQRTSDNRLAIGGRGAPYAWGSRRNDATEMHRRIHHQLRELARDWFPVLADIPFPYSWGGAVAITRDWSPYVRWNNSYGELGGYAGDGVTLSYLTAATMADLVTGVATSRTQLPYVQWRSPAWEREPLRWIAINSAIALSSAADWEERRTHRSSLLMKALAPIIGK